MARHRAEVRPRYGRIATASASLTLTGVAVLGGVGVLPSSADEAGGPTWSVRAADDAAAAADDVAGAAAISRAAAARPLLPRLAGSAQPRTDLDRWTETALPADSGTGRRVVFSESRQRVWLVRGTGEVRRTYPVSGSRYDNLDPGSYEVYSRSRTATGIEDSGTMRWFVRFTRGDTGAAIGFHDIPVLAGEQVQSVEDLGTPQSHGCIRQRTADARALWGFAPVGTRVVVVP